MEKNITLEEAVSLIQANLAPLGEELLPVSHAKGRILTQPVLSEMNQPPFNRSPLDGYALHSEDSRGASLENPLTLEVVDTVYAGGVCHKPLGKGQCVRIFTGAMIPEDADCVLRQEDTDRGEKSVRIFAEIGHHANFVFSGEDFAAGDTLLPAGTKVDTAALAVLSSAGFSDDQQLAVRRMPNVCVICSGDELTYPYIHPLPEGKIYDANLSYILGRLADFGIGGDTGGQHFGDDPQALTDTVEDVLHWADAVITTGGVSVGAKDYLPLVLDKLGADTVFAGVTMKPGSPVHFAMHQGKPILCLSGNPFAAAATFELLGRPMLAALSGDSSLLPVRRRAVIRDSFGKASRNRRLIRAHYDPATDTVTLPDGHSSGQLLSMVGCNCLVDIPAGSGALAAGTEMDIILL